MNQDAPKRRRGRGKALPEGVRDGIVQDLAMREGGTYGSLPRIANKWDVCINTVKAISLEKRVEIDAIRGIIAERALMGSVQAIERVVEDLSNDDVMKETPMKDKAQVVKLLTDAGTTALEGNKATLHIGFNELRGAAEWLRAYDEEKKARGRVIDVKP